MRAVAAAAGKERVPTSQRGHSQKRTKANRFPKAKASVRPPPARPQTALSKTARVAPTTKAKRREGRTCRRTVIRG